MEMPHDALFVLWHARRALLLGLRATLVVSAGGLVLGLLIGVTGAVASAFGGRWLRLAAAGYAALLRGIPVLVTLFFLYYGVAAALGPLPAEIATSLALGLFAGAQLTEIGRGALLSIPRGLIEAAMALGFSRLGAVVAILLPLAGRRALPSSCTVAVQLVKASTLASALGVGELLMASQQVAARTLLIPEVYLLVWAMFVGLNLALAAAGRRLERRWRHAAA